MEISSTASYLHSDWCLHVYWKYKTFSCSCLYNSSGVFYYSDLWIFFLPVCFRCHKVYWRFYRQFYRWLYRFYRQCCRRYYRRYRRWFYNLFYRFLRLAKVEGMILAIPQKVVNIPWKKWSPEDGLLASESSDRLKGIGYSHQKETIQILWVCLWEEENWRTLWQQENWRRRGQAETQRKDSRQFGIMHGKHLYQKQLAGFEAGQIWPMSQLGVWTFHTAPSEKKKKKKLALIFFLDNLSLGTQDQIRYQGAVKEQPFSGLLEIYMCGSHRQLHQWQHRAGEHVQEASKNQPPKLYPKHFQLIKRGDINFSRNERNTTPSGLWVKEQMLIVEEPWRALKKD